VTVREFEEAAGSPDAVRRTMCRYFKRGLAASFDRGELVDLLCVSNDLLAEAGFPDAEVARILEDVLPAITDRDIATSLDWVPTTSMSEDHDPWNEPSHRHPRAQELMAAALWDCVDEAAPFGSDEGADAYEDFREWRLKNSDAPLMKCIEWVGDEENYSDEFTFDATIIATVLGQLVLEGRIDPDAKPVAHKAIQRQLKDADKERREILEEVASAIEAG